MVAQTNAICTCPRRLAARRAETLKLQVLEANVLNYEIKVQAVRRAGVADAGVDGFLKRVRAAKA